jgi:uncharacterized RDD family membrane protein YckC
MSDEPACPNHPFTNLTGPCARCGVAYCGDCLVEVREQRVCAGCKTEILRDYLSGTAVDKLPIARLIPRFAALLLDRLLVWVPAYAFFWFERREFTRFGMSRQTIVTIQQIVQFGMYGAYYVYEGAMLSGRGHTLGKMAMHMRVVAADGTPIRFRQAWIRGIPRLVAAFLVVGMALPYPLITQYLVLALSLVQYGPALLTRQRLALHDLIAHTRVIRSEP